MIGRVVGDPFTERTAVVGGFRAAKEEQKQAKEKRCCAGNGQQQVFAFPGFHRQEISMSETVVTLLERTRMV